VAPFPRQTQLNDALIESLRSSSAVAAITRSGYADSCKRELGRTPKSMRSAGKDLLLANQHERWAPGGNLHGMCQSLFPTCQGRTSLQRFQRGEMNLRDAVERGLSLGRRLDLRRNGGPGVDRRFFNYLLCSRSVQPLGNGTSIRKSSILLGRAIMDSTFLAKARNLGSRWLLC